MPIYSWKCRTCNYTHNAWMLPTGLDFWQPSCGRCGELMDYDYAPSIHRHPFAAFETVHLTGAPVTVDSLGTLRKLEKQHNCVWPAYSGGGLMGDMPIAHTAWEDGSGRVHRG